MRKLIRPFVLFCAIAATVGSAALTDAPARQKDEKKDKKDAKTPKDAKGGGDVGSIEVFMAKDGWRIRVKSAEGKSIAVGTVGYDKQDDALKTVELLKATFAKGNVSVEKVEPKKK